MSSFHATNSTVQMKIILQLTVWPTPIFGTEFPLQLCPLLQPISTALHTSVLYSSKALPYCLLTQQIRNDPMIQLLSYTQHAPSLPPTSTTTTSKYLQVTVSTGMEPYWPNYSPPSDYNKLTTPLQWLHYGLVMHTMGSTDSTETPNHAPLLLAPQALHPWHTEAHSIIDSNHLTWPFPAIRPEILLKNSIISDCSTLACIPTGLKVPSAFCLHHQGAS